MGTDTSNPVIRVKAWLVRLRNGAGGIASRWREQGDRGERVAARYLREQGYRVLGCNLRSRFGEVDIFAQAPDGHTVVVVEVKSSEVSKRRGTGVESALVPEVRVGARKRRRLVSLAVVLARRYGLTHRPIRFDVVGVDLPAGGRGAEPIVRHHVGAFEAHV